MGSNISKTASEISKIMKEKNIQPGTPEWFQLWFSKPYLTGEKLIVREKMKEVIDMGYHQLLDIHKSLGKKKIDQCHSMQTY